MGHKCDTTQTHNDAKKFKNIGHRHVENMVHIYTHTHKYICTYMYNLHIEQ